MVDWLTLLIRIREFPASNLVPETDYRESGFSQSLQVNVWIVP
jgi:hypothetical protein